MFLEPFLSAKLEFSERGISICGARNSGRSDLLHALSSIGYFGLQMSQLRLVTSATCTHIIATHIIATCTHIIATWLLGITCFNLESDQDHEGPWASCQNNKKKKQQQKKKLGTVHSNSSVC